MQEDFKVFIPEGGRKSKFMDTITITTNRKYFKISEKIIESLGHPHYVQMRYTDTHFAICKSTERADGVYSIRKGREIRCESFITLLQIPTRLVLDGVLKDGMIVFERPSVNSK